MASKKKDEISKTENVEVKEQNGEHLELMQELPIEESYESLEEMQFELRKERIEAMKFDEMTIMAMVAAVVSEFEDSIDLDRNIEICAPLLDRLAEILGLTRFQVLLLSVVMEGKDTVSLSDIARFVCTNKVRILAHKNELDDLVNKGILRRGRDYDGSNWYKVKNDVLCALVDNHKIEARSIKGLSSSEMMGELDDIIGQLRNRELSWEEAVGDMKNIFLENRERVLSERILSLELTNDDLLMLAFLCSALVVAGRMDFDIDITRCLYHDSNRVQKSMMRSLSNENNALIRFGLVEHTCEEGMDNNESICLTDKAKHELLSEYDWQKVVEEKSCSGLTSYKNITRKDLFYNDAEGRQINELRKLLMPENFKTIQQKLKEKGMRQGIACLLYGAPGVGKTESVYQIARETGRDIVEVNVESIKSKWVGDSEQNIRSAFRNYNNKVKQRENAPILLFNEADSILGIRKQGAESAVDKMEVSIQSIILQEMEKLEGIMIATTNLTSNLDRAFDRRFIYKVEFKQPESGVRAKIWRSMMPGLSEVDAARLAQKYPMSGGQIENISRRRSISEILFNNPCSINDLELFCSEESIHSERKAVGF